MKKLPISLICGIAAMVATIALYFLVLDNAFLEVIHFVTLMGILIAEGITTVYAWKAQGEPRKVAAAVTSGFMIPYAAVLSFVYVVNFPQGYVAYMGWYFAGAVVINAIAWVLCSFAGSKQAENTQLQAAKNNILQLRKLVKAIMLEEGAKPYEARLRALEENLHFTNDGVIAAEDDKIRLMLLQLQENISDPEYDVEAQLTAVEKTVRLRTVMNSRNV